MDSFVSLAESMTRCKEDLSKTHEYPTFFICSLQNAPDWSRSRKLRSRDYRWRITLRENSRHARGKPYCDTGSARILYIKYFPTLFAYFVRFCAKSGSNNKIQCSLVIIFYVIHKKVTGSYWISIIKWNRPYDNIEKSLRMILTTI